MKQFSITIETPNQTLDLFATAINFKEAMGQIMVKMRIITGMNITAEDTLEYVTEVTSKPA